MDEQELRAEIQQLLRLRTNESANRKSVRARLDRLRESGVDPADITGMIEAIRTRNHQL